MSKLLCERLRQESYVRRTVASSELLYAEMYSEIISTVKTVAMVEENVRGAGVRFCT